MSKESYLEAILAQDMKDHDIRFERQYRIAQDRRWKFDFHLLDAPSVLIEVQGGTHSGGRHTRGYGYEEDAQKYARAAREGYITLCFTGKQVKEKMPYSKHSEALETIFAALEYWGSEGGEAA